MVSRSAREESPRAARTLRKNGALPACPTASMPSSTAATTASAVANGRSAGTMQRTAAPASSPAIAAAIRSRLLPKAHSEAPTAMRGQAHPKWAMHTPSVVTTATRPPCRPPTGVPHAMRTAEQHAQGTGLASVGEPQRDQGDERVAGRRDDGLDGHGRGPQYPEPGEHSTFMSSQTSTELAVVPSAASAKGPQPAAATVRVSRPRVPRRGFAPVLRRWAAVRAWPIMGRPLLLPRLPLRLSRVVGWEPLPSRPVLAVRRASYRASPPRDVMESAGSAGRSVPSGCVGRLRKTVPGGAHFVWVVLEMAVQGWGDLQITQG